MEIGKYSKNKNWYNNTADALKQWSLRPDAFEIDEFFTSRDIPQSTYYQALIDSEVMKEAHEFAKSRIGINRQRIAIEKNLGINSTVAFTLPRYLKSFREEYVARAKLKEEQEQASEEVLKKVLTEVLEPFEKKKNDKKDEEYK